MNNMSKITMNLLPANFIPLPIYMYTVSSSYKQDDLDTPSGRDFHQILFVVDGKGILKHDNKIYELKKGCAFFTAENVPVSYRSTDNLVTAFLTVKGSAVAELENHFECSGFLFRETIDTEKYLSDINAIIDEFYSHRRNSMLSSLCYSFFINFFEQNLHEHSLMREIALYIEKRFTKKLTLKKIADKYGISVSKLSHEFKKEFNQTVFDYILNLRLSYARNLIILNPDSKIKDAALSCGFDDISYFCKAYKNKFGVTPSKDKI